MVRVVSFDPSGEGRNSFSTATITRRHQGGFGTCSPMWLDTPPKKMECLDPPSRRTDNDEHAQSGAREVTAVARRTRNGGPPSRRAGRVDRCRQARSASLHFGRALSTTSPTDAPRRSPLARLVVVLIVGPVSPPSRHVREPTRRGGWAQRATTRRTPQGPARGGQNGGSVGPSLPEPIRRAALALMEAAAVDRL
jgi:hypothetical protein